MEELFCKLVDKAYILPISEENKDSLKDACDKYLAELDLQKFNALTLCFIYGERDKDLWSYIKQFISANSLDINVSKLLCKNLAQYIVVATFLDDSIAASTKANYSLSLMNMVVGARSSQVTIPYSETLQYGVNFYLQFYNKQAVIKTPAKSMLIPSILTADGLDDIVDVEITECFEEIQYYCRFFARKKYINVKNELKIEIQNVQNDYEKAYYIARTLSQQDWVYVDPNPISSILEFNLTNKSKKKLSEIKPMIEQSRFYESVSSQCDSSPVLKYLDEFESYIDETIKFSPLEFAIALYYEFLYEYNNKG